MKTKRISIKTETIILIMDKEVAQALEDFLGGTSQNDRTLKIGYRASELVGEVYDALSYEKRWGKPYA